MKLKSKTSVLLVSVCMLTVIYSSAQSFTTPEVYSFKQEVFRPVSYYTGQANISIPLTQVQTQEITIPVTLNYVGGSGLRAINPYSSAGMGWRVSAGGAITRTKNGVCDEVIGDQSTTPNGFFSLPVNSVTNEYVRNNVSSYLVTDATFGQRFGPSTEYAPDVFSFSFLGYSGFFVMGYDGQFKIQSQDIVSVEKIDAPWPWPGIGNCVAFRLTANDGTQFTFGSTNGSIEFSGGNSPGIPYQCEAWYLTSIKFTNGRGIGFDYQPNSSTFVRFTPSSDPPNTNYSVCPVVLSDITFTGGTIVFTSSTVTQQINGQGSYPLMINKIELKDATNQAINTVNFAYSTESSSRYYLLDAVTIDDKKYSFGYYNRTALPGPGVYGADYWGFYNGQNEVTTVGTGNVSSFWDMYLNPTVTYGPRMGSTEYAKRGILTSITYPTGAVESYEYEANTYSYLGVQTNIGTQFSFSEEPQTGGGLRIAKITLGDMVRKYKYVNSFDPNKPDYDPATMSYIGFSSSGILYRLPGVPYFGRSVINALSIDGEPPVVYSKVIEFRSDKSYTEYSMRSPLDKPDGNNNQSTNYYSVWSNQPGIFSYYPKMAFVGSLGKLSSCALERGQVSSVKMYDATNVLKKSIVYSYATDPNRYNQYVAAVNMVTTADRAMGQLGLEWAVAYNYSGVAFSAIHSYNIYTFPVYLEQEVETDYEGGNASERTTQYQYNAQKLRSATITYTSKGDLVKTLIKYPADINTGNYAAMVNQKMLNYPVEQVQLKNNMVIGGSLSTYKQNGSRYVVDKKYSLETSAPFSGASFTYFDGSSKDSRYSAAPEISYDNYNTLNGVLQTTDRSNIHQSFEWGYNNTYPVAQIKNAENSLTTTSATVYGSVNMPSSGDASTSFTTAAPGNIVLSIMGDPGNIYAIRYDLTGPSNAGGYLCASRSTTGTCNFPETVTLTTMPPGSYSLHITLYSGTASYMGATYSYQGAAQTGIKEFFYEGFEENLSNSTVTGAAHTGNKYWNSSYTTSFNIPNSKSYTIQWWNLSGGKWIFNQQAFTGNLTLPGPIDDVRILPTGALMSTYTYKPLVGMTSETAPTGLTIYYEYDSFGRLKLARDDKGNVVKTYCYNYAGQPVPCN